MARVLVVRCVLLMPRVPVMACPLLMTRVFARHRVLFMRRVVVRDLVPLCVVLVLLVIQVQLRSSLSNASSYVTLNPRIRLD
jgi:hypothetical protein